MGVMSDIHRVRTSPDYPMDVRNKHQQGTCPQAISSSNFFCVNLSSHFLFSFVKTSSVQSKISNLFDLKDFYQIRFRK